MVKIKQAVTDGVVNTCVMIYLIVSWQHSWVTLYITCNNFNRSSYSLFSFKTE